MVTGCTHLGMAQEVAYTARVELVLMLMELLVILKGQAVSVCTYMELPEG